MKESKVSEMCILLFYQRLSKLLSTMALLQRLRLVRSNLGPIWRKRNLAEDPYMQRPQKKINLAFHWNSRWVGWITSSEGQMAGEEVG